MVAGKLGRAEAGVSVSGGERMLDFVHLFIRESWGVLRLGKLCGGGGEAGAC